MTESWRDSKRQLAIQFSTRYSIYYEILNLLLDTQCTPVRDHLVRTKFGLYITGAAKAHDRVVAKLKSSARYAMCC